MVTLRKMLLPPYGRSSYLVSPSDVSSPLIYLGWGPRHFGDHPLPLARTFGAVYTVVTSGHPTLLAGNARFGCKPGSAFILGENCPIGWTDRKGRLSNALVWIWQSRPQHASIRPEEDGCKRWIISDFDIKHLEQIHRKCRKELSTIDAYSSTVLQALKEILDAQWARMATRDAARAKPRERVETALNWMRCHLATRNPVAEVANYLEISESTLQRDFRKHLGKTPLKVLMELKTKEAQRLLRNGASVKEAAFQTGYRHPNDFCRFLKNATGQTPRQASRASPPFNSP